MNGDHLLVDGCYLPVTLTTARRDPIPDKAQLGDQWAHDCQQQAAPLWNLITPSGINFSVASSAFQGAVRQGKVVEACQWALEMHRTDSSLGNSGNRIGKGASNLWTRMIVIGAEDIALANPFMIIYFDNIIRHKWQAATAAESESTVLKITIALCHSLKSRAADWACICRIHVPEPFDDVVYFNRLVECLVQGNHAHALGYAEAYTIQTLANKSIKLDKGLFDRLAVGITVRGKPIKHYVNKRQLIWVALLKALADNRHPNVREITESCYGVAHKDGFRWEKSARLFERMAILAVSMRDAVEPRGIAFKAHANLEAEYPGGVIWTDVEIEAFRVQQIKGNLIYGVSDVAKDKHNREGKQLNRGIKHFIEIKAFLKHEDEGLVSLSDWYLELCCSTRKEWRDELGADYGKTIPALRARAQALNLIENAIGKDAKEVQLTTIINLRPADLAAIKQFYGAAITIL